MIEGSTFHRVISEHLALSERNKRLERTMPLERYREQYEPEERAAPTPDELSSQPWTQAPDEPLRRDPDSFWDASGERPPPMFDWGDD